MSIFPYVFVGDKAGERMVYSSDPEYALHRVQEWKRAMGHCQGMDGRALPIYVNAIGTTVAQRNYINDTCYQATFIVKNIISLLGEVGLPEFFIRCPITIFLMRKTICSLTDGTACFPNFRSTNRDISHFL